jgi:hypothetical protein
MVAEAGLLPVVVQLRAELVDGVRGGGEGGRVPGRGCRGLDRSEARRGYLLKDRILHRDEVVSALNRIAAGQTVIDESIVATLLGGPAVDPRLAMLTAREREALQDRRGGKR